jgi:hypothetical protein
MHSSESSSNWDFTAVIDLLHIPTYCASIHPDICVSDTTKGTSTRFGQLETNNTHKHVSYPKLGDFGTLWEILPQAPLLPSDPTTQVGPQDADTRYAKLLLRTAGSPELPSNEARTKERFKVLPRSSAKPITILSLTNACSIGSQNSPACTDSRDNSSDSSVDTDCYWDRRVFDSPVPSEPVPVPIVSRDGSNAGNVDAWLTPPTSCDELEGVQDLTVVNTKHSLSLTKYSSATARQASLIAKLFKTFPDYAGACRKGWGLSISEKEIFPSSQIHVFVDSSNVSSEFSSVTSWRCRFLTDDLDYNWISRLC